MYPLLKKPLEQIGTYIDVPGNYWQGRMSAEEKGQLPVLYAFCQAKCQGS